MLGQRPPVLPLQPRNKTRDVFPYPSPRFRTKEPSTDPLMQEIQLGSNHIDDHIDMIDYLSSKCRCSTRSRQHMLTVMETTLEIAEGAASNDPNVGLRAVAALRALTERLEILQVESARMAGWSWQEIADRLGVTKQTVHRKYGRRIGRR
jgi:DNA-binding NarL/FixJ family response regulator